MLESYSKTEFGLATSDFHWQTKYLVPSNREYTGETQNS